jgi:hypothetical protein
MKLAVLLIFISIQYITCLTNEDEMIFKYKTSCACPINPNTCDIKNVVIDSTNEQIIKESLKSSKISNKLLNKILLSYNQINEETDCNKPVKLSCNFGQKILIKEAFMSNFNASICSTDRKSNVNNKCNENSETLRIVNSICDSLENCDISINQDLSNICPCAQNKYLKIKYECIEDNINIRSKRNIYFRIDKAQRDWDSKMRNQKTLNRALGPYDPTAVYGFDYYPYGFGYDYGYGYDYYDYFYPNYYTY